MCLPSRSGGGDPSVRSTESRGEPGLGILWVLRGDPVEDRLLSSSPSAGPPLSTPTLLAWGASPRRATGIPPVGSARLLPGRTNPGPGLATDLQGALGNPGVTGQCGFPSRN